MEILTTITSSRLGVTVFRWVVNRMPVLAELRSTARRGETREDAMIPHDILTLYTAKAIEYLVAIAFIACFIPSGATR